MAIFNRSHYEDVLVVRVHGLVPEEVWKQRYDQINQFERILSLNNIVILKFYLHISKAEQKERMLARINTPDKRWKFRSADLPERACWDDYMAAYEDAINKCSTDYAPWYVVPANKKWYRNLVVARAITDTLEGMNPQYPQPQENLDKITIPD
jgi:polyphosphate kinase 2 (PPK2 family)